MTPEARKKRDEISKKWTDLGSPGVNINMPKFLIPEKPKSRNDIREELGFATLPDSSTQYMPAPTQRYPGEAGGVNMDDKIQDSMSLEDFTEFLTKCFLVDTVYCLDDAREDEGFVHLLIKLIPLANLSPRQIDEGNEMLTNFLALTRVQDAKEVHVSFQYTEVYK